MWTGKQTARWGVVIAALLAMGCQAVATGSRPAPDAPATPWWYDIGFKPASTSVHGIDVDEFDPAWTLASVLDSGRLEGRISAAEIAQFEDSKLSFSLQSDLDRDGTPEEFFVGVFRTETGDAGRFVAIASDGRLLRHFAQAGSPGFSALLDRDGEVRWYKCMECGEFETIRWTGDSYVLE